MHFIDVLEGLAAISGFCFATVCLAAGLYYMAEFVEEHTVLTKKVIRFATVAVVILHLLLWLLDGFPFLHILFSMLCHGFYSLHLKDFPFISLTSPVFIGSVALVLVDHFMWFFYFSDNYYRFSEVASFFGLCVWLIPFVYFISLSASDNTLPTDMNGEQRKKSKLGNHLLTLLNFLSRKKDDILPQKTSKSL